MPERPVERGRARAVAKPHRDQGEQADGQRGAGLAPSPDVAAPTASLRALLRHAVQSFATGPGRGHPASVANHTQRPGRPRAPDPA